VELEVPIPAVRVEWSSTLAIVALALLIEMTLFMYFLNKFWKADRGLYCGLGFYVN